RHLDLHKTPLARFTLEAEFPAEALGALLHPHEAEMAVRGRKYVVPLESAAIILDLEIQTAGLDVQSYSDRARAGMLDDVCHRFLGDAQYMVRGLLRDLAALAGHLHVNANARAFGPEA